MKRFIIFFVICALNPVFTPVYADETVYRRAETEGVYIYEDSNCILPVFELPPSYFVKTVEGDSEFSRAFLYDESGVPLIDGFVKKSELTPTQGDVENPYLQLKITSVTALQIYQDAKMQVVIRNVFAGRTFTYFGRANLYGNELFFIRYENTFGYAEPTKFAPFDVPVNEYGRKTPDATEQAKTTVDNFSALKIFIIIFVSLAALLIVLSIFIKPQKKRKSESEL